MREICTLRVMWRELETGLRNHVAAMAPIPDPLRTPSHDLSEGMSENIQIGCVAKNVYRSSMTAVQ